jgi:YHS domain-containing protein
MIARRLLWGWGLLLVLTLIPTLFRTAGAYAQLPADAVMLDKVKIPEKQKSVDLCPVYLEASDPKSAVWEYKGVKYRGSKPDAKEKFLKDPDKYAKAADKQRFINNFVQAMSTVWCPVTDEITPGGMTQWKRFGLTFESCCAFCDESFEEDNFVDGLKKLKARAEKTYELIGAKYTEGAKSPVEGAIKKPEA